MENNALELHGLGVIKIAPWLLFAGVVLGAACNVSHPPDLSSIIKAILIGVITSGIHFFYWRNGSLLLVNRLEAAV